MNVKLRHYQVDNTRSSAIITALDDFTNPTYVIHIVGESNSKYVRIISTWCIYVDLIK